MYNKKGQAALEFLTTYGWAFLVILVMIGALSYFGVLNPDNYVPDACNFGSVMSCSGDYGITYFEHGTPADVTDDYAFIIFDVTNLLNARINVTNVTIREKTQASVVNNISLIDFKWSSGPDNFKNGSLAVRGSDRVFINISDPYVLRTLIRPFINKKKTFNFEIEYVKGTTPVGSMPIKKVAPGAITTRPVKG